MSDPTSTMSPKPNVRRTRRSDLLANLRAAAKAEAGNDAKIRAAVLQEMRQSLTQGRDEARAQLEAKKFKGAK